MIQVFSEVSQSLVTFLSRILLSFLGSLTAENTVLCFLEHGSVGLCLCLLDCLEHGMAGLCFLFNRNHDTINLGTSPEHNSTLVFETFGQGTTYIRLDAHAGVLSEKCIISTPTGSRTLLIHFLELLTV